MIKKFAMVTLWAVYGVSNVTSASTDPLQTPIFASVGNEWEIHGVVKSETAMFTSKGQTANQAKSMLDNPKHHAGGLLKFENSLNIFVNRQFTEATSLHTQLNLIYESEGLEGNHFHRSYTQNDYLRELYLDTTLGPVDIRLGKQQEVWGTVDGIKLLDILNPTDYREFVQNTMADSRIPVWMLKTSTPVGTTGNLQFLAVQPIHNRIPGLNEEGDPGGAFIHKGVDAITGKVNGFKNIVPQMGKVAGTFHMLATRFELPGLMGGPGFDLNTTTVQDFVNGTGLGGNFLAACPGFGGTSGTRALNADCLHRITQATNHNQTMIIDGAHWHESNPNSAFEYMNNATFATFNTMVNLKSVYRQDYPDDLALNVGMRYKNSIGGNLNYTINYLNHYDPNPYVQLSWINDYNEVLIPTKATVGKNTTLHLRDLAGNYYGMVDPITLQTINRPATLAFTEKMHRINTLGGSFDTSVESGFLGPVVVRGEGIYQLNTMAPVMDRSLLAHGDLVGALQSKNTDFIKYGLGAEFIVFTNLTMGTQFIQFINLDFVDEPGNGTANSGRYTADQTVLSLSNGFQKAARYKEFVSLFLSKPLGTEQQARLNLLTMIEERGGWWHRLDGEWKLNDNWVAIGELNQYWGNENTMFGQFQNMSNFMLGIKYIF